MGFGTFIMHMQKLVRPAFQNAAGTLSNSGNAICTLFSVGVGGLVYLALVVLLRAISPQDLKFMPKGDKIGRLLRITPAE